MLRIAGLIPMLACASCISTPTAPFVPKPTQPYGTAVALNEPVWLYKPYTQIKAIEVLEDSRCPPNARCLWEGKVRLRVIVTKLDPEPVVARHHSDYPMPVSMELSSTDPAGIFGGDIAIDVIEPLPAQTGQSIAAEDYTFTFSFKLWDKAN